MSIVNESAKLCGLHGLAWVRGTSVREWRGPKICVDHRGCVGLQNFGVGQKNGVGRNFGVGGVGP